MLVFYKVMVLRKTQHLPITMRPATRHAWTSRWAAHPSAAAMRALACSPLHLPASEGNNIEGSEPYLATSLHFTPTAPPLPPHPHT